MNMTVARKISPLVFLAIPGQAKIETVKPFKLAVKKRSKKSGV